MIEIWPLGFREKGEQAREECGVFGIWLPQARNHREIAYLIFEGLQQNQHRGEESVGIAVGNGRTVLPPFTCMGLVKDGYSAYQNQERRLEGYVGVGHNRYSTTGSSRLENAGPFRVELDRLELALSHNGNLTNAPQLKEQLTAAGIKLASTTDSEILACFIAIANGQTIEEKIIKALQQCQGSFSLAICTRDTLYAARDPLGNRPLHFGSFSYNGETAFAVSSETPALEMLKVDSIAQVEPGELIRFNHQGINKWRFINNGAEEAFCGLEIAYLLRPDGRLHNIQLDAIRRALGARLAKEHPPPANIDYVTYIPESAKQAAEGYAEGLSNLWGRPVFPRTSMIKGRYGLLKGGIRGFISPHDKTREEVGRNNYFPFDWLKGARVVVVDDSIIRGTTTYGVIQALRKAGAMEIHLRIPWPPVLGPCPLGTDIGEKDRLVYRELDCNIDKVREHLRVDSLVYLSPDQFQETVNQAIGKNVGLCLGCVTGNYPVTVYQADKTIFELE